MSLLTHGLHYLIIVLFCLFSVPGASYLTHQPLSQNGQQRIEYDAIRENKGLTVAFPEEISITEAKNLIENAKWVFLEASKALHKATGGLTSLDEINFLIPRSWPISNGIWDIFNPPVPVSRAKKETYEIAAIRVTSNDTEFQGTSVHPRPLTVQYSSQCGKPGKYILVPKAYFNRIPPASDPASREIHVKELIKEYARFRFGVFEERGYADDLLYPLFSVVPGSTGRDNHTAILNSCTNTELVIAERDANGGSCTVSVNETSGLPNDDGCYMDPIVSQNKENLEIQSSIMFSPEVAHGRFCDKDNTVPHNPTSPNRQNAFCNGKSVMTVIRESPEFQFVMPGANPAIPRFNFLQEPEFRLAILLDVGKHMLQSSPTDFPLENIRPVLELFFEEEIPANITAYVGSFDSKPSVNIFEGKITDGDRQFLVNKLSASTNDPNDSCLQCALQALLRNSGDYPVTVAAITNAKIMDPATLKGLLDQNPQIKLNLIIYPSGVTLDTNLRETILSNAGKVIDIKTSGVVSTVVRLQEAFTSVLGKESHRNEITKVSISDLDAQSVPFSLSQVEGITRLYICAYQNTTRGQTEPMDKKSLVVTLGDKQYTVSNAQLGQLQIHKFGENCLAYCFSFSAENIAMEGSLNFTVTGPSEIVVKVWVVSSTDSKFTSRKINLRSWFEWVKKDKDVPNAIIIYAELRQGTRPIRGADVTAKISHAGEESKGHELKLYDNGAGDPDIRESDGIYSRYYSAFSQTGGYTVSILAIGDAGKVQVLEQFPIQDFSRTGPRWTPLESFRRSLSVAETFQVNWEIPENLDIYPPNRIMDLRVLEAKDREIVLTWTAPGNNYDDDTQAAEYNIKYFTNIDDARLRFNETGNEIGYWQVTAGPPLKPDKYGLVQTVNLKLDKDEKGGLLYFALTTSDASNNTSPVSNVVVAYLTTLEELSTAVPISTETPGNATSSNYESGGLNSTEIGLIVGFVLLAVILIIVVVIMVIYLRRKKAKKEPETITSMIRPRPNPTNPTNPPLAEPKPLGGGDPKPSFETPPRNGNIPTRFAPDPPDPARLSVANGDHIQSWPAETLLSHYDRVQEAKQRNQPRPILSVVDLLESLSESNSSVASVPIQHQNGTLQHMRRENGSAPPPRSASQLSSHSKQVTQV